MRMRVDKAREQELTAHVDDLRAVRFQPLADGGDLFAVYQHIRNAGARRGDDRTVLE